MTEDFLQFIWKFGLFDRSGMFTDTGETVEVIALGEHNQDAGPDFLNSRIRIGNTLWAGNVEVHVSSSDWQDHGHDRDKAYDNVILHVVYRHNRPVTRSTGEAIPCVELSFPNALYENYRILVQRQDGLPCRNRIGQIDRVILHLWLNALVVERLQQKADFIRELLEMTRNNWEEAFYISLAHTFGFSLNAIPFESLARSLPWMVIERHRSNAFQLEALLLGQAGFLPEEKLKGGYPIRLQQEYWYLRHKYNLKPMEKHLWKFLRLRPVNFPTIRIAQFAALLSQTEGLFSHVVGSRLEDLGPLFQARASSFWDTHYTFETASPVRTKRIGKEAFQVIVINAVIPFLFVYGQRSGREEMKERALDWLNRLPPERNRWISRWQAANIQAISAFYSQGLIQLSTRYCSRKRCLFCSVGSQVIRSTHPATDAK
jgi:hypothetical protein